MIARIARGEAQFDDYENVGYFYPQYSSSAAIIQLISDVYNAVGPDDISSNKFGDLAIAAGALYIQETSTRTTVPLLVGINGLYGSPTNQVVVLLKSNNSVSTMYPLGLVRPYVP